MLLWTDDVIAEQRHKQDSPKDIISLIGKQTETNKDDNDDDDDDDDDDEIKFEQQFNEEDEFNKLYEEMKISIEDNEKRKIIRSCIAPTQNAEQSDNFTMNDNNNISDINKAELETMMELIAKF